jgi:surface protein
MKNTSSIFLINLFISLLSFSKVIAQSNPDTDCPAPENYLVGEYQVVDVNATIGPGNSTENIEAGIYTITGDGNTRTFQAPVLPAFNSEIETINFVLNCGVIQIQDVDPNLNCGNPSIPYIFTTTDISNSTTYSLSGSDTNFTINYIEDPNGSCAGPYNSSFSLTKVCSKPQDVSFANSTMSSVDMSWLDTNNTSTLANTYTIEYGNQGFSLGSGQSLMGITGNSTTISNLSTNNPYDFYIRGVCSDGTFSDFVGPFQFTIENVPNSDFVLDGNGVTCLCPNANFGDTGTVMTNAGLKTFTKRTRTELDNLIASDNMDPQIALTCTTGITNMASLFFNAFDFNQDIQHWDVSNVTDMTSMFFNANSFNYPVGDWDVSNVTNMLNMFYGASSFNQPINNWNVSNVTNMAGLFKNTTSFNQPLDNWDVSNVTNMASLFAGDIFVGITTAFNQPLSAWDVSNVTNMAFIFNSSAFNQPLNSWDVSNVINMGSMFFGSKFNQPINSWNVSNVENMQSMFANATAFNQDLSVWNFNPIVAFNDFLDNSGLDSTNYDTFLQSVDNQNLINKTIGVANLFYCDVATRDNLINNKGWSINDDEVGQCGQTLNPSTTPFVTTWAIDQTDLSLNIYTVNGYNYDYSIDWGDGQVDNNVTTNITHTYAMPGNYTVSILGVFPHFRVYEDLDAVSIDFQNNEAQRLVSVDAWGDQEWRRMKSTFAFAENMVLNATDAPDLSNVNDMSRMFYYTSAFNQPINNWDVSNVKNMSSLFQGTGIFNQPLDSWDVSNVTDMEGTFQTARAFNQNINNWNVSNVTNMGYMFHFADKFNQPLNNWNVSNVTNMGGMFWDAYDFNQPLDNWDVSNVTTMGLMFAGADDFNQPLNSWDVSNVTFMRNMFLSADSFNQPLDNWVVSNVEDMAGMFALNPSFNQPLNNWDVSSVKDFSSMFSVASTFNQPLDNWNVSSATSTASMFAGSPFNQDISNWDVSNVVAMAFMFSGNTVFNQPLNNWDVSNVTNMWGMFNFAQAFNQPLDNWNVSNVEVMLSMFNEATVFNQDISGWCVENILTEPGNFSTNSALQNDFKPNWGATCTLSVQDNNLIRLSIYPNPVSQVLNLQIPNINESINVEVYNLLGQNVMSEQVRLNNNQTQLNVAHLKSGVYLVRIDYNGKTFTKKFIKE